MMNTLQKVASDISGYGVHETGAKNDHYYDALDKHEFVRDYAYLQFNDYLYYEEVDKIVNFLDNKGIFCENDRYHAFKELGEETKIKG